MALDGKHAVVLLSGGLDSSTCLAIARSQGFLCHALTVHYGQRNSPELEAARAVAAALGAVEHRVVELDLSWIGGSALTAGHRRAQARPPGKLAAGRRARRGPREQVPVTYVPARNSLLLCLGAAWAEVLGTPNLFIGVNRIDYSGYPDCRPAFVQAMQQALRLGTRRGDLVIHTPLIELSKAEIIRRGTALGLDYALTWSCYDPQPPGRRACGRCDACVHRRKGFVEAGLPDPDPLRLSGVVVRCGAPARRSSGLRPAPRGACRGDAAGAVAG